MITRKYEKYEDYVEFQLRKTRNKEKQKKWLGEEWGKKIKIFKDVLGSVVKGGNYDKAICLGARTGQEVVALKELGVKEVIGIDLEEFPPYTIKGGLTVTRESIKY